MGTYNVKIRRQFLQKEVFSELFDRKNIHKQRTPFESLQRQGFEHLLGGDNGGTEENNFWVLLAEVIWIREEDNAELASGFGVIRARVSENSVALTDEGLS